jgi:hypothetical protein
MIKLNGVDMPLDVSFKNFGCIWSDPGDLVTFNFSRCFCIISGLILDDEGGINTDDKTKSELLNTFFQSVFTVEADSQNAPTLNQRSNKKLSTIEFNPEKILLSSFILIAIVRSYSYFAFLTNLLASVLASSYFVLFCGFLLYLYFQSVFTVEADSQNAPTLNQRSNKKLSTIEFNPEIIQKHLEKLKVTKSPGDVKLIGR